MLLSQLKTIIFQKYIRDSNTPLKFSLLDTWYCLKIVVRRGCALVSLTLIQTFTGLLKCQTVLVLAGRDAVLCSAVNPRSLLETNYTIINVVQAAPMRNLRTRHIISFYYIMHTCCIKIVNVFAKFYNNKEIITLWIERLQASFLSNLLP